MGGKVTTGGCHCGAVQFRIQGVLAKVLVCHCRDCRKTTGNSMAATGVRASQIEITGEALRWYGSSEKAERGFCSACGANMFYRASGSRGRGIGIAAGMLDDPSALEFGGHIYLHDHQGYQPLEENPVDLHELYMAGGIKLPDEEG